MGDALGKGLLAAFLVFCFMALTGGIALISGIVALLAHGVAKTVATWIFGISLTAFSLPLLQIFVINPLKDRAAVARYEKEYKAERTPLIVAVENRDIKKVKKLIKKGADVNEGKGYRTPLIVACERVSGLDYEDKVSDYDEIVRILLESGAEADLVRDEQYIFKYSTKYFSNICAMPIAIEKYRDNAVKMLIEHGANIDTYEEEIDENGKKVLVGKDFMPFQ
ncbi:MAG: ankyrin repeat domain-containing protein, partial [Treponema sp.]|nr:ankyrin repeat domain-containing protein [Treponema sp.]